ncbi:MAG: DUF302 domain-containing protein [Chromatiaceae bacterium]|nr:DUF302 domain-containing protein [Chromatiaceae bacterium]MCP5314388.1 DUF302 domain-containing protein [Chromatiaceae bacterium]
MYEFNVTLTTPFDQAVADVSAALAAVGFGIVSDVDVRAILLSKLGKEIPGYRILGTCNPGLADRVISAEPNAGVLLPCNVVVRAVDERTTVVSFMQPSAMLDMTLTEEPKVVAAEAANMLQEVVGKLTAKS